MAGNGGLAASMELIGIATMALCELFADCDERAAGSVIGICTTNWLYLKIIISALADTLGFCVL